MAGFEVATHGRFWVAAEDEGRNSKNSCPALGPQNTVPSDCIHRSWFLCRDDILQPGEHKGWRLDLNRKNVDLYLQKSRSFFGLQSS